MKKTFLGKDKAMDMKMKVTFVGTGSCVPSGERSSPSLLVEVDGKMILIDCGPGTCRQLEKLGIDWKAIDVVMLTHYHNDHISDFPALVWAYLWTPGHERKKDLVVVAPTAGAEILNWVGFSLDGNFDELPTWLKFKAVKDIFELPLLPRLRVRSCRVHHPIGLAYRLEFGGNSLVVTGDTGWCDKLVQFAEGANVLIADCSFPDKRMPTHMTPEECARLASEAPVGRLFLTHIYPVGTPQERLAVARGIFPGKAAVAYDGMVIEV